MLPTLRAALVALLIAAGATTSFAQDNAECMRCHEDEELYFPEDEELL